jgi:2-(1,2-epoxy-1,2-dihydrophenyl)acetyl-CoA isomerase
VITTDSRDAVTIVRLERNTLVPALFEGLTKALTELANSTTLKPLVLTGSGTSFCLGADLNWLASCADPAQGVTELVNLHNRAVLTIVEMPVPVIAAINGRTAGGGLSLALAVDYALAADTATFTAAYFRLGLTPDGGTALLLRRAIGLARTRELLLTNQRLSAADALAWGMLNEVVEPERLLDRALAFAANLAHVPAETLRQTRRLLDGGVLRHQLERESEAIITAARGDFFKQALATFRASHPSR